jgi:hypothetical protein
MTLRVEYDDIDDVGCMPPILKISSNRETKNDEISTVAKSAI